MAHHNFEIPEEERRILESFAEKFKPEANPTEALRDLLGATGKFPDGKLGDHDEGEFRYRVGSLDGRVVVDFGAPVHSLGFLPEQADELAFCLRKHAECCRNGESP